MKTRKNENSWKVREQPFAGEFSEMGGGGRVSSCRPLSGKSALVGNESRFCRSKRPRHRLKCLENAFPAIFQNFLGEGPQTPTRGASADFNPVLSGMSMPPKLISPRTPAGLTWCSRQRLSRRRSLSCC